MNNNIYSFSNILSEIRRSLRLAFPLIASEMIYALNGFIATIMVAHLGKNQLAANALVWSVFITVILFFIGVLSAVSIMVSQSYGAKDNHGVSQNFKQGIILAIIFAIPMTLVMWFSSAILGVVGQKPEVIFYAKPFFHSLVWGMLPLNLLIVMEQFLIGISRTRLVMFASIIQMPIQMFFYYGFLFGKFGLPQIGLVGIGYSLFVSYCVTAIFFGLYLYCSRSLKMYKLFYRWWKLNRTFLFEMLRVGMPLGFLYCIEVALLAVVAFMMGRLGTTILAAYQIAYQYWMVALTLIFALTQATAVRVGFEVGRNNREALKLSVFVNTIIGISFMSMFCIAYFCFSKEMIALDLNIHAAQNQFIIKEATLFLSIVCILLISDSIRLISLGALRGIKDTRFPVIASIIGFWCVAFPGAYLAAFKFHFGGVGILWSLVVGLSISGIILWMRFNRLVKRVDLNTMVTR